jgi:hypothetical protein
VRGQQSPHIAESGGCVIKVQPKEQKIADCSFIKLVRHLWMQPHAIQNAAEYELIVEVRVIKRLNAEMITSAKESFSAAVPDRKREVASQMMHALRTPRCIGTKNQIGVCCKTAAVPSRLLNFFP